MQNLYGVLLERYIPGVSIDYSSDGRCALNRAAASDFDIILSDIDMPVMDGIAFHRELEKEAHPLSGRVAYISGTAETEHLAYVRNNSLPFLAKPFKVQDFYDFIDSLAVTVGRGAEMRCGRRHVRLPVGESCRIDPLKGMQDYGLTIFAEAKDYSPAGVGLLYQGGALPEEALVNVSVEKISVVKKSAKVIWTEPVDGSTFRSGLKWV